MPFQSEKQRRYLWANEPEIARDWTDTYGSGIAKALGGRVPLWTGGFPDFFQMTPENISQARSLPWKDALSLEKQYAYDPKYTGADKTSWLGHKRQGLRSLMGMTPEVNPITGTASNVGGATPLTRKLALGARNFLGQNIASGLPLAYAYGAQKLQENIPESLQGVLSEDIFSQGAMGAGAGITPEHAEILKYGDPIQRSAFQDDYNYNPSTMAANWSELDDVEARNIDAQRQMELAELVNRGEQYPAKDEYTRFRDTDNFMEYINKNPELMKTMKDKAGGILEYAKAKGIQGKDLLMAGLGKAINFPIGLVSALAGPPDTPYQKFMKDMFKGQPGVDPTNPNKDPWGKNIRSYTNTYDVTDQWDKFAGSVLGQKYGLEALGKDGLSDEEIAQLEKMGLKGYQLKRAKGLSKFNQKALAWKKQKVAQKKTLQDHQNREARQAVLAQRQAAADRSRAQTGQTTSGGAGHYDASKDHSRAGGYGGKGRASDEARSQDLGFSDIRLKDNIELMGQSPSNINIYKFNYLNDPTVYQGVMAQEVPWASVTADNGYLMVDYNKVDVEFKKWPR